MGLIITGSVISSGVTESHASRATEPFHLTDSSIAVSELRPVTRWWMCRLPIRKLLVSDLDSDLLSNKVTTKGEGVFREGLPVLPNQHSLGSNLTPDKNSPSAKSFLP